MGKAKKFRAAKVRAIKRTVNPKHDPRLKDKQDRVKRKEEKKKKQADRHVDQTPASMFFAHNTGLGPPFHVIVDTNFCLLYTSPSPRDYAASRMPSSA